MIAIGSTNASRIYLGTTEIQKIYQGSNLVWSGLDSDALAYVNAITIAGATVSISQQAAISDFVKAEKAAGRWTTIKRLYLPIWGVAAANAICMVSLTSGRWVGGVTHAAGYVQGDGSTGYFNTETPSVTFFGSGANSVTAGALRLTDAGISSASILGAGSLTNAIQSTRTNVDFRAVTPLSYTPFAGIVMGWREGTTMGVSKRDSVGYEDVNSTTITGEGADISSSVYYMARNNSSIGGTIPTNFNASRYGVVFSVVGSINREAFSLNIKSLYENLTNTLIP